MKPVAYDELAPLNGDIWEIIEARVNHPVVANLSAIKRFYHAQTNDPARLSTSHSHSQAKTATTEPEQ